MTEWEANVRTIPGVLFIEDFDEPGMDSPSSAADEEVVRPTNLPLVPEPVLDLDEIRRLAFEEGVTTGHRLAEESMTARRCDLLSCIENSLEGARATMRDAIETHLNLIAGTALQVISDCLPAFCERNGAEEIRALLRSTLAHCTQEPSLVVLVNPVCEELVREETARLLSPAGPVSIILDAGLPFGDVTISWATGAIQRETGRLRHLLLDRLHELGLLHEPERSSL